VFIERGLELLYCRQHARHYYLTHGILSLFAPKVARGNPVKEDRPTIFADLGYSVLDTVMLETAAYCPAKEAPIL
jgi:hypothetical protein